MRRYRIYPLQGVHPFETNRERPFAVQAGGAGGRIIGEGWHMSRERAEELARELEAAYEAGMEERVSV